MRRNHLFLCLMLALLLVTSGCAPIENQATPTPDAAQGAALTVTATLFPQYDFARYIAGERARVTLLLPPGVEPHVFEPTPGDVTAIADSDLLLYTGADMEPWAARILSGLSGARVLAVDVTQGIARLEEGTEHDRDDAHGAEDHGEGSGADHGEAPNTDHDGASDTLHDEAPDALHDEAPDTDHGVGSDADHGEDHSEAHAHASDPHIWLDPRRAAQMATNIEAALTGRDPEGAAYYKQRADALRADLAALDSDIAAAVASAERTRLAFGGRFALAYFMERYGLTYVSAYDSCSSQAEPSVRQIADIIAYMEQYGIPAIYHEEMVDPRVARTIAEDTGARLLLFHSCHNVSLEEQRAGATYLSLMRANLENLKVGLD